MDACLCMLDLASWSFFFLQLLINAACSTEYCVNFVKIKLLRQHNRRTKFLFFSTSIFFITPDDSNIAMHSKDLQLHLSPKIHQSAFLIWLRIAVTTCCKNWWFIWNRFNCFETVSEVDFGFFLLSVVSAWNVYILFLIYGTSQMLP